MAGWHSLQLRRPSFFPNCQLVLLCLSIPSDLFKSSIVIIIKYLKKIIEFFKEEKEKEITDTCYLVICVIHIYFQLFYFV